VPELPEVEAVRLELEPVMRGHRFERVIVRRPDLRQPFPRRFASRLRGRTVKTLERRGKYLLAALDSNETILMHLGMSGSFRTNDPRVERHDHVVFVMSSGARVIFNDPRRFGLMDLVPTAELETTPPLDAMGPEPLSAEFGGNALAQACARKRIALKVALLDQCVVAGVGNIYASEALHVAGLSPRQRAGTIATAFGEPRESAYRLAAAIKSVLRRAITRQTAARYRSGRFRVYERAGEPCVTRGCAGVVVRFEQAGRSTYFCPVCQRARTRSTRVNEGH
jgi:formamidopyrimidine-DNA glycosylase